MRDLAGFDFQAQPSLDPRQVRDLAAGRFVASGEAVLLLGPPGVGKTRLVVAIGREAIRAGYSRAAAQRNGTLPLGRGAHRPADRQLAAESGNRLVTG